MRLFFLTLCLALAAALALAQPAQHPSPPLLCGDSQTLWLVRPSADGSNFDVLFRPTGEKWRTLASALGGKVGQAASMGGTLHVIFKDPLGQGMFQMNSPEMAPLAMPSDSQWPQNTPPLALCAADRFGAITTPSLIALVAREADALLPASAPASRASTSSAASAPAVYLQPFQFADGKWRALSPKPADSIASARFAPNDRVLIAVAGGRLYRMISGPGRQANAFAVWDNTNKDLPAWRPIPMEKDLADSKPVAMLTLAGKLTIVAAGPGDNQKMQLALFVMEDAEHFSKNAIQLNQKPYTWDASSPPVPAAMGEQFEMVWQQDGKIMDSRCALSGKMKEPEEIPTASLEPDAAARQAYNYFLGAIFLAVVVLLALRRNMLPKPFELSPQMIPGNLLKRGMAALVDMLPWFGIAILVIGLTPEEIQAPFNDPPTLTNKHIFVDIMGKSLYVIYCTLMETFMGTTVGKMIFRLRVVGDQGQRPTLRSVALRNLMKVMELLPIPLPLLSQGLPLLLFFPIFSPYRLRIGDLMARTSVVETRTLPPPVPVEPPQG